MALTTVITYDISEDHRRARAAATLQIWGDRIQRSVFLCTLEHTQLQDLVERLAEIIDTDTDAVHVFRQCAACWDDVTVLGQATTHEPPCYWAVL